MVILLANDDGYRAKGINILERVLLERGHRVLVAAPETEQSGKSHGMTLHHPLRVTKRSEDHYVIGGTPADCVIYSLCGDIFGVVPDVIIGGINHGYNQSIDIVYSGTCAVARQASLYGIKSIAVSAEVEDDALLERTAGFVADNLSYFLTVIRDYTFLNINVPLGFNGQGRAAGVGLCHYHDYLDTVSEDGDYMDYQLRGGGVTHSELDGAALPADHAVCLQGYASLSLVEDLPGVSSHTRELRV